MMTSSLPPASRDWCLFLDVDGTLIELSDTPFETRASEELTTTLRAVSKRLGGALALVSGRSIEYLDGLFAPLHLPCAGLHGVERRSASDGARGSAFKDPRLDRARVALAELVASHAGTLLEDKGRTVAVHYRLAPHFEAEIRESVDVIVATLEPDFHVQGGNMMLELKPRGFTKGIAIGDFMREPPFAGRIPVFAGDDLTDLDGFRVVEELGGFAIAVGERVQAKHHLDDPAAVRAWLRDLAATA